MTTLGIIGGIAPESTVEYYRAIIAAYRRQTDGRYPPIIINSIDLQRMLGLIGAGDLAGVTEYLLGELRALARAGADLGLLAANTPHIVFEELRRESPVPLVSIVEAACDAVRALKLARVGLLGTRFTMQGRFYPEVFSRHGITLVVPDAPDQDYVHGRYMSELVNGVFLDETRASLLAIVDRMRVKTGIQGILLAGTELPLVLGDVADRGIPFLDTARIHAEAAVTRMLA